MWKIKDCISFVILISFFMIITLFFALNWRKKIAVYKTINYNQYIIIVFSRTNLIGVGTEGQLYIDIWLNAKKTKSYRIVKLDEFSEYDMRIKDITILPDTWEIKVEFSELEYSKSKTGVDLYKIE
jgi:hypothetical protein